MSKHSQYGFNVLELMVAVAVLGVLLGLGVPSFTQMIRDTIACRRHQ
jgi:prepilin-type N-terminal cleavage/methylation domain-containing protein